MVNAIKCLSCLAKVFYSILSKRLQKFCVEKEILSPSQLGFLPGNTTSAAHLILHTLIRKYCHKNEKNIYACFVDFSKSFDNLPREILFSKIQGYGITGRFLSVLQNLYSNDRTCIKIDNKLTESIPINVGVRQGCILSPYYLTFLWRTFLSS